jgi:hypothetical protein
MSDWRDLIPPASEGRLVWYGTIGRDAVDLTDQVPVILPEFDEHLEWGPCPWQSRDLTSLPAKGDACLVIFDNRRVPWIVAWWPF